MDINTCFATTAEVRNLALYSHLVPALAILVLGFFAHLRALNRHKSAIFLSFTTVFTTWLVADLINWITNDYGLLAATWAPLDYLNISFFLLLLYFVFVDISGRKLSMSFSGLIILAAAVPFWITLSGNAVHEFNQPVCEMIGNDFLATYKLIIELMVLLATGILGVVHYIRSRGNRDEQIRTGLITGSIFLFMGVFSLAEYISVTTEVYEIMLYSLFSLPIFILILTLAITSYGTFKLGDAAVRLLFYIFLILAATQFFFVGDITEFLLASMSFGVVLTLGLMLYFTTQKEMQHRHLIEIMNRQQEGLLSFISHEVKGYLAKGQAAFAGIVQGDYGSVSPKLRSMADSGLTDMRKGVDMVGDILDASNLRNGTVAYEQKPFNLKTVIEEIVHDLRPAAEERGLALTFAAAEGEYSLIGDEAKFRRHVVRNLIDNAVHYTQTGSIAVSLSRGDKIHFSVKDTGVGITKEDMQNLFTEGGHGKDSQKINVDSTGYGLFIAKQVTEAHGGKIWVQSKGKGQGSEFIVELPST